jgi:hypothetical protein
MHIPINSLVLGADKQWNWPVLLVDWDWRLFPADD